MRWRDLERCFGCLPSRPLSLVDGPWHRSASHRLAFDFARMFRAVGLTPGRARWSTLAWLRGTAVDDVVSDLRFCPECLALGYHTVVFQLACVATCPSHRSPLVAGCPACGKPLAPMLDRDAVDHPFACGCCGGRLVPRANLVNPPPVDATAVREIIAWYRHLCALPVIALQPGDADRSLPSFAPSWRLECLGRLGGRPAPAAIAVPCDSICGASLVRARFGTHLAHNERWQAVEDDDVHRYTAIYKAYRRHVQKNLPRGTRRLLRDYVDGHRALWGPAASAAERDRRAAAYGLLLFRAGLEHWPDIFLYGNAVLGRRLGRDTPFSARRLSGAQFSRRGAPLMAAEVRWLLDHRYGEEVAAQFRVAMAQARHMAMIGHYQSRPDDRRWAEGLPYCVGLRHQSGVEFCSWGPDGSSQDGDDATLL